MNAAPSFERPNEPADPFAVACAGDSTLQALTTAADNVDKRIGILSEHLGGINDAVLTEQALARAHVSDREQALREAWDQAGEDPTGFALLVRVNDLRAKFEADPDDQVAREALRKAKEAWGNYAFGSHGQITPG